MSFKPCCTYKVQKYHAAATKPEKNTLYVQNENVAKVGCRMQTRVVEHVPILDWVLHLSSEERNFTSTQYSQEVGSSYQT